MRFTFLAVCVLCLGLSAALVQASPAAPISMHIDPANALPSAPRTLSASRLPAADHLSVLVIDPSGNEQVIPGTTDVNGTLSLPLQPPAGGWAAGLYRVALETGSGRSESATFVAGDGNPHLLEMPDLPSPTSVLTFIGTGLPPNTNTNVVLTLTSDRGEQLVSGRTDADGTLVSYLWPGQLGLPFFSAGLYQIGIPDVGLSAGFAIREHPVSSTISVRGPVLAGGSAVVHFQDYRPNRTLWVILANAYGRVVDEFLPGVTDVRGVLDAQMDFSDLPPGRYFLATPYEWGETSFDVLASTPTAVASPTSTGTPSAAVTPAARTASRPKHRSTLPATTVSPSTRRACTARLFVVPGACSRRGNGRG